MRGADAGPWWHIYALPAFWVGLLYDKEALDRAYEIAISFTKEERNLLYKTIPLEGIHTLFRNKPLQELALEFLNLSHQGLERRNCKNAKGQTEACYLPPLFYILTSNQSLVDKLPQKWPSLSSVEEQNTFIRSLAY